MDCVLLSCRRLLAFFFEARQHRRHSCARYRRNTPTTILHAESFIPAARRPRCRHPAVLCNSSGNKIPKFLLPRPDRCQIITAERHPQCGGVVAWWWWRCRSLRAGCHPIALCVVKLRSCAVFTAAVSGSAGYMTGQAAAAPRRRVSASDASV